MIELIVCYALNVTQCWAYIIPARDIGLAACLYGGAYVRRRDGADLILKGVRCEDGDDMAFSFGAVGR